MAALVAARREDVTALVTVAANLDHAAWTAHHGDSPLSGSLSALGVATTLSKLPQVHFSGEEDDVVPASVNAGYLALSDARFVRQVELPDFDHHCCWVANWPVLLRQARETFRSMER